MLNQSVDKASIKSWPTAFVQREAVSVPSGAGTTIRLAVQAHVWAVVVNCGGFDCTSCQGYLVQRPTVGCPFAFVYKVQMSSLASTSGGREEPVNTDKFAQHLFCLFIVVKFYNFTCSILI
jgi:hypothetical protein